jgi:hypothetical protein
VLCEIEVSAVAPFPGHAVLKLAQAVLARIQATKASPATTG